MPYIVWRDAYCIGHPLVDEQHQGIISFVNETYEAVMSGEELPPIKTVACKIEYHARNHFRTEESLLKDCGYPQLEKHKVLHVELLERVQSFSTMSGTPRSAFLRLLSFMKDWIVDHMMNEDRQYEPWMCATTEDES